jgi:hypothetical protein
MTTNEYTGYWWIPSFPDNKIPGSIKISEQNEITLELLGTLPRSDERLHGEWLDNKNYEIILGFTREGELITIFQANCCHWSDNYPGINSEIYNINYFLIGVHYRKLEEMKFFKLKVRYSHLSIWTYLGSPKFLESFNNQFSENKDLSNVDLPELTARTTKGEVKIGIDITRSREICDLEVTKKKTSEIMIKPPTELPLEKYYEDYLYPLQNFLTLATNQKNSVTKLIVFSHHGEKINHSYHDSSEEQIEVIASRFVHKNEESNKVSPMIIFSLGDIENEFPLYIQKWLNISDEIQHICKIYFELKYIKSISFEFYFLSIVKAIESYHRLKINPSKTSLQDHKDRLEEIYDAIPEKHRDWLKKKLAFSHEPTLKDRLDKLITIHKGIIQPFLCDANNINNLTQRITRTRNYYTHYDQLLDGKYAKGSELFRLAQVLSFLLLSCLLSELGCTSERCVELVSRHNDYKYSIEVVKAAGFEW